MPTNITAGLLHFTHETATLFAKRPSNIAQNFISTSIRHNPIAGAFHLASVIEYRHILEAC
jgi:hypothetical protein